MEIKNRLKVIDINQCDGAFNDEIQRICGENARLCLHCGSCANGCPFTDMMDYRPNAVLRMVQMGILPEVLKCSTIWVCVACNTCSSQCPMAIDIPAIMDTLSHMALKKGIAVGDPDILNFHRDFLASVEKYGRSHKLEIMMRYKLRKRDWFGDMTVGMKMLGKRKLHLLPSRIKNNTDLKKLFKKNQEPTYE